MLIERRPLSGISGRTTAVRNFKANLVFSYSNSLVQFICVYSALCSLFRTFINETQTNSCYAVPWSCLWRSWTGWYFALTAVFEQPSSNVDFTRLHLVSRPTTIRQNIWIWKILKCQYRKIAISINQLILVYWRYIPAEKTAFEIYNKVST